MFDNRRRLVKNRHPIPEEDCGPRALIDAIPRMITDLEIAADDKGVALDWNKVMLEMEPGSLGTNSIVVTVSLPVL